MEWNREAILRLQSLFNEKHMRMRMERKTDRRNLSAMWNRYISMFDTRIVFDFKENTRKQRPKNASYATLRQQEYAKVDDTLSNFIKIINYHNIDVADSLVLRNPDRPGQYLLIKRDMAERVLVLGMP